MFYKQRLQKLLIKTSHLLQRSQYAAPWPLLREATISNNFPQRKEKIPERLLHQSPKFLIQMFASEDACENLFGIPYFSDYKYLNSLGSFQDGAKNELKENKTEKEKLKIKQLSKLSI